MTALIALGRWFHDASVMALFGSAALLALLSTKVPELAFEGRALAFARRAAALVALVSAPLWLTGMPRAAADLARSLPGQVLLARLVVLVLLVAAVWSGRRRAAAWLAGAALVGIALTGHVAGASPQGFIAIGAANDSIHLLTAGYWIGGLAVLAAMLAERPKAARLGEAVSLFAEWGMIAVALLVMTGIINAAMVLLGSPGHDDLFYAGILAAKILLAMAMIAIAIGNHIRLLPRLAQPGVAGRLRKRAGWELGLGLVVVGLAGLLTLLSPTHQ